MSAAGLKIATWIVEHIPDFDFSVPAITVLSTVSNIFAWVSYFIPVNLVLTLLSVTGAFYSGKFLIRLYRYVREVM